MPSLSCIANEDTNAAAARFISAETDVAVNLAGELGARRRRPWWRAGRSLGEGQTPFSKTRSAVCSSTLTVELDEL